MYTKTPTGTEVMWVELIRHARAARRRRRLIRRLRRLAATVPARDPLRRRSDPWLHDRLGSARAELAALADALQGIGTPDALVLRELEVLVADGCASPLLNPELHVSELRATLYYVRSRLRESAAPPMVRRSARAWEPSTRPSSPWAAAPGSDIRFPRR